MPCVAGPVVDAAVIGENLSAVTPTYRLDCHTDSCTLDLDIKTKLIENPIELESDDLDYISDLLEDLRHTANTDDDASLKEFVKEVDDLLAKVEKGELTKEQLLDELRKAEERFRQNTDQNMEETMADLEKTGQELKKEKLTRELGKALEKGDLEKAQQEMEKLANQLDNQELSDKQRKQIAKALEKAAEKFEKREKKKDQELDKQIQQQKKQVKKLKRQLKNEKNPEKREKMSRRLDKKKRELDRLERKKQQRKQSQARRNLKELHRNMKSSAQNMKKNNRQQQKQASRRMRDMKRNTGKVDSDRRKIKTQKKVASQLTDLREAMRRAKKRGNRGPKDLFGKNRKNRDFGRRARGLKGKRGAWKPGQGKNGRGLAKNGKKPGGKGNKPGGSSYGDEHDPNLLDAPTPKSHDTQDESVSGVQGKGPSVRETILSAAQKGFATRSYKKVYASYKSIVEEVMQTEKVPSGYKYYIKRYFQKIKPHSMD
jgi:chemotaxis protein histidine kinase CheA